MSDKLKDLERNVIDAAIALERATAKGYNGVMEIALVSDAVRSLLAGSDVCTCSRDAREYCASTKCHGGDDAPTWVERTWRDVRQGDVIRPAGPEDVVSRHEALVVMLGPVNHWHATPDANEYRPHESPLEWSSVPVTLSPIRGAGQGGEDVQPFTPPNGMNPDAPVQICVTRGELAAIEMLGGWGQRVTVYEKDMTHERNSTN